MKINIYAIPKLSQPLVSDAQSGWLRQMLQQRFADLYVFPDPVSLTLRLQKYDDHVCITGSLELTLRPVCARCAAVFRTRISVSVLRNMFSLEQQSRNLERKEDQEAVQNEEDESYGFYEGEEVDLSEIVAEEIQLALPVRFLCRESCRGLCVRCGTNLNQSSCSCVQYPPDSPFAVLKKL